MAALLVSGPADGAAARLEAIEAARDLESMPATGVAAADRAEVRHRLLKWMRAAGLERIEIRDPGALPPGAEGETGSPGPVTAGSLTGVLPAAGGGDRERQAMLLVTMGRPGGPGWADDIRASVVALEVLSELAGVPRRHTVRLLLLEREGSAREAAARWVGGLDAERRDDLLAVIDLDGVGGLSAAPPLGLVRLAPIEVRARDALRTAPGWLVHAVLAAGRAVGEPLAVAAPRCGLAAQLLARSTSPPESTAGDAFLAAGVPTVSLGGRGLWAAPEIRGEAGAASIDPEGIGAWRRFLTAMVRRLDVLDGRPRADGEYLAWLGRVWSRRDLYWAGLGAWILLVFGGLPGRWRGRPSGERSLLGRRYLPGFAARGLTLVTLLALPVFSLFLLLPGALAWIADSWLPLPSRIAIAFAALPWVAWAIGVGWLLVTGRAESFVLGLPALLLLGISFGAILWTLTRR